MKCKKFVIESDGTAGGTSVMVDGKKLESVGSIDFALDEGGKFPRVLVMEPAKGHGGVIMKKTVKVRNHNTQKIEEREKIVLTPVLIEFDFS